jgi:pyrroline-5-carboxylate reductase
MARKCESIAVLATGKMGHAVATSALRDDRSPRSTVLLTNGNK